METRVLKGKTQGRKWRRVEENGKKKITQTGTEKVRSLRGLSLGFSGCDLKGGSPGAP